MFSLTSIYHIKSIVLVSSFALIAFMLSFVPFIKHLALSPLIIGIVLGMLYANTFRSRLSPLWNPGIVFCTKTLLRAGIVLYGFRITFTDIVHMGLSGIVASSLVVVSTLALGYGLGTRWLKLDAHTALLTSIGSAVCGAAAVLALEGVLKNESHKSALAVSTVVLFGAIAMFVYPMLYALGWIPFSPSQEGLYIGATVHEVAQVVAAGSAISADVADSAIIVKMFRVMLLVPLLMVLGVWFKQPSEQTSYRQMIPWFALGFMGVALLNSFIMLPPSLVDAINIFDTFLLTMAMSALGMQTHFKAFRGVGGKAILLALSLFVWLMVGGWAIVSICTLWL